MLIQNLAKLRISRNGAQPEYGAEIVPLDLILKLSLILKHGGILQGEHRETAAATIL
jgi:hypothetical protein